MNKRYFGLLALALAVVLGAATAQAGALYQLDFHVECPPEALPLNVTVNVYESDKVDEPPAGTSSATYDGVDLLNYTDDDVAKIVGIGTTGNSSFVNFSVLGYDNGKFKSSTTIEVCINGVCAQLFKFHTSCSKPIPLNTVLTESDEAVDTIVGACDWTVTGGVGECIPGASCPGDVSGNPGKLYELDGFFSMNLGGCVPSNVTLTLEGDKGTSTATWDGVALTNIVCDNVACLTNAFFDGGTFVVEFESFGYKGNGEYSSGTKFNIDLGNCGEFEIDQHTSCSQAIILDTANPLDTGSGSVTWTAGCGGCVVNPPVAIQQELWGTVKSKFKE